MLMIKTLLIVEYRENLRALYENELKEEGYRIVVAENEKEALYILHYECPDLVIISGEVVVSAGIILAEKIKRYCPHILLLVNAADFATCENLLHSSDVTASCIVKSSDLKLLKRKIKDSITGGFSPIAMSESRKV